MRAPHAKLIKRGSERRPRNLMRTSCSSLRPMRRATFASQPIAGANLPNGRGLEEYDGIAITGSALSIYDGGEAVERQLDLTRAIYASKTPFFGSCWGLQLAAAASGGTVVKNPLGREIGIARNIAPTEAGRKHPLLAGRPGAFDAPCTHLDVVAVPPGETVVLADQSRGAHPSRGNPP